MLGPNTPAFSFGKRVSGSTTGYPLVLGSVLGHGQHWEVLKIIAIKGINIWFEFFIAKISIEVHYKPTAGTIWIILFNYNLILMLYINQQDES